ncbi:MAG: ATP-binding protein [Polyangiales bacterium]
MDRSLATLAFFAVALLAMLAHRIRRDTGDRVDTRYFQLAALASTARVLALTFGLLAGIPSSHPLLSLASVATGLASAHSLVLFAYSFPLNRVPPRWLRYGLAAVTFASTAASQVPSLSGMRASYVLLFALMPSYFALAVVFLGRNRWAATAPGQSRPSAPVTLVQVSVVVPWALSLALIVALERLNHRQVPLWVFVAQAVGVALGVLGGTGVAVLRYHLFDVRVLMAEVVLAVSAAGAMAAYVGLAAPPLHAALSAGTSPALATVVVAAVSAELARVVFGALARAIKNVDDALAGGAPARSVVERTMADTARTVDPDVALAAVLEAVARATSCGVRFLRAGELPSLRHAALDPSLAAAVRENPRPFYSTAHAAELPPTVVGAMERLGAQLLVPVRRHETLYGLLLLERAEAPGRAATEAVVTLADHLALKLENHSLYAEAAESSRALAEQVTERLRLTRELEESRRLAALGAFAAAIAHDIRTPLTSVQMNVQILRGRAALSEDDREYLDIAVEEIERLNRSVGAILEYARPVAPALEPDDLGEVAADVLRALGPVHAARGVKLSLVRSGDPAAAPVPFDEALMRKVLVNLVDNAVAASPSGATVTVTTAADDAGATLEVCDRGRGIDPSAIDRIFEPFFTTRPDGTGLGLAIVQKVVRAHQGDVRVESGASGTRFRVTLPRAAATS